MGCAGSRARFSRIVRFVDKEVDTDRKGSQVVIRGKGD